MNKLREGIYAASLIPLDEQGRCQTDELAAHCFDMINQGCEGVVLFGTAGEGYSFSVAERINALEALLAKGFDPQKIIVANASANIPDTIALAKAAKECAALLLAPACYYKKVSEEGVIAYYQEIIRHLDNPRILLYHIPQYTGVPITLNIIKALREQVLGLKESEGNRAFTKEILEAFPGFQVFVGSEKQIIEAVSYGAAGSICGMANLYPALMHSLYVSGKKGLIDNPPEAEAVFALFQGAPFIPRAKALLAAKKGDQWRAVRPPLLS